MRVYALTDVGRIRPINEDSYYAPEEGERFVAVADGMGGHQAGEVASALAIRVLSEELRAASSLPVPSVMEEAVGKANRAIYEEALSDRAKRGMGTTLTALWFGDDYVCLSHVGDSRAYLLRNRAFIQLSNDHSLVGEMVERGEITPREALTHPQRNFITRALGTNRTVEVDMLRVDYLPGDVWLLCTDGLTNHMRSFEMSTILLGDGDWNDKLHLLVELALKRGGSDNITALLVTYEEAR